MNRSNISRKLFVAVCMTVAVLAQTMADEIETTAMKITLTSGETHSVVLSNDESFIGPRLHRNEKTLVVGGKTYNSADVKSIRFEKVTIDGIRNVETGAQTDGSVYDLQGRKVADATSGLNGLKRGIYIVNGKKITVR